MIRFTTHMVTFAEIPDEISLSFNISNCQNHCVGCHSPELRQNIGGILTSERLSSIVRSNDGITCVLFLGEGNDLDALLELSGCVHSLGLKSALYSGRETDEIEPEVWASFDYVKVGPYVEWFGPLSAPTTNQRLYKISPRKTISISEDYPFDRLERTDITKKFWREI